MVVYSDWSNLALPYMIISNRAVAKVASFPGSPRFSVLQAMESWAVPGNEVSRWCDPNKLLWLLAHTARGVLGHAFCVFYRMHAPTGNFQNETLKNHFCRSKISVILGKHDLIVATHPHCEVVIANCTLASYR